MAIRTKRFRNCWERPRREMCELVGRRMQTMGMESSANAWNALGAHLERLGDADIPKFVDLITAMRAFTIKYKGLAADLRQKGYEVD